ncbi:MAG: leucine-rich repeat domain-containing protein, partial [Pirellulales bacterium]|nr:leucine-rich repeat domain-containing protein [Pirellulales bacterium]
MKRWLVGLLLAALAGVLLVVVIDSNHDPIEKWEGFGAGIERDERGDIVEVNLSVTARRPSLDGLDRLIDWYKRFFGWNRTEVIDADMAHLKEMHHLHTLYVSGSINGKGLVYLKGMTKLQSLTLTYTQITDVGLVHLNGLTLSQLSIPDQAKTDLGLKHYLAATETHTSLTLESWRVTDSGLVHLRGLTELQTLNLRGTQITDAGLAHLKGLTNLQELDISNTKITGAGLVYL